MTFTDILIYIIVIGILSVCIMIYIQNRDDYDLKCIVSDVNGQKYCVRNREKLNEAADLLANVSDKCRQLVEYMYEKVPDDERAQRLKGKFNPKQFMETLPTSEYTAYSENKGEKLAFCLNKKKKDNTDLIDQHTLEFVAIHELSHIATKSIGHETEFWENFKFLLENAKEAGIHDPADYKKDTQEYCGMKIRDNPFYDV
jgi:hypothetical protein